MYKLKKNLKGVHDKCTVRHDSDFGSVNCVRENLYLVLNFKTLDLHQRDLLHWGL